MFDRRKSAVGWLDALWLIFILGLALLPAEDQAHKQLILLAFAVFQFFEGGIVTRLPRRGRYYAVLVKILLAMLLIDHTGEIGINSSYYEIYYLPVITAAMYFDTVGTMLWTALASLTYCSFLIPALQDYELTPEADALLAIRVAFFFVVGILVNRIVVENRTQVKRYQELSERLEETNRQLRRAEAEARRSERLAALGQLSAGLAHEIRNPLGVIKGSAEMLTKKLQDARPLESELASYISSEVNRLNALVARFLDFARPQNLQVRPIQVSGTVDRALESAQQQLPNERAKIVRNYAPGLPEILADEQLCEQVFVNLILNAFQAMGDTGGIVTLSIAPEMSKGTSGVAVTVEDTGPGVPAELREQIFNPFFTSKKDGVGLGLSIVVKIVDDHRGWIRLESSSTGGARFHVFLPEKPEV